MTYTEEHAAERLVYWKDRLSGTSICEDAPGELDDQDITEIAEHIVNQERELDERRHQAQVLIVAEGLLEAAGLRPDVGAACEAIVAYLREEEARRVWRSAPDYLRIKRARIEGEKRHAELVAALADLVPAPPEPSTCQSCGVVVTEDSDACRACEGAR